METSTQVLWLCYAAGVASGLLLAAALWVVAQYCELASLRAGDRREASK